MSILPESSAKSNTVPSFAAKVTTANEAMVDIVRLTGGFFRMVQQIIIGLGSTLPALAAPVSPATFAGWAVYQATPIAMNPTLRILVAIAAAVALETVGLSAAHATLYFYSQWQAGNSGSGRVVAGLGLVVAYVAIGIGIIWLVEDLGETIRAVGTGAFLLAMIAYATLALLSDVERTEARQKMQAARAEETQARENVLKQNELDFQRQRQIDYDERQFKLALKKMDNEALIARETEETQREKARLNSRLKLAQFRSAPAQTSAQANHSEQEAGSPQPAQTRSEAAQPLKCEWCGTSTNAMGQPISTTQALNAHKQFCSNRPVAEIVSHNGHNGNGKELR